MALILGYDTESTGLDTTGDYILEVAAIIYDTERKQPVDFYSSFILWPSRPKISSEAQEIHHISAEIIEEWGSSSEEVFAQIMRRTEKCDWVVGHNVLAYDKPITETAILRCHDDRDYLKKRFYDLKWMDTMVDLPYPKHITTRSLRYLALEHGYIANNSHRAISDVLACLHLVSCYDYSLVQEIASTPLIEICANVSYTDRDKAKTQGFRWRPETKQWVKTIREYYLADKYQQLDYDVTVNAEKQSPQSHQLPLL